MKAYRTGSGSELIKEVELERQTEKSVWIKNTYDDGISRFTKHSHYDNFWQTKEEAKKHLFDKYSSHLSSLERNIESAKKKLKELDNY